MAAMEQIQGLALQQTLSPQMQQSLQILQAPLMELRQLVAAELEANPTLEEEPRESAADAEDHDSQKPELSDQWNEYYAQRAASEPWTADAQARRQHFFDSQTKPATLQQHLLDQVSGSEMTARQRGIALVIIGNIDDQGYLRATAAEIASSAGCLEDEAEKVIEMVQTFEPAGVAARDLSECLLIQLRRSGRQYSLESRIVQHHLEELSRRKLPEIARQMSCFSQGCSERCGSHRPIGASTGAAIFRRGRADDSSRCSGRARRGRLHGVAERRRDPLPAHRRRL